MDPLIFISKLPPLIELSKEEGFGVTQCVKMEGNINKCYFGDDCSSKVLLSVSDCTKDTTPHLMYFKCNNDIEIPESLLILNRAGIYTLTSQNL